MRMTMETKLYQTIRNVVFSIPVAEIDKAVEDLQCLLGKGHSALETLKEVVAHYNNSRLVVCALPGTEQDVLITNFNDHGDGLYSDPVTRQLFRLDHLSRKAYEMLPWSPDTTVELWRVPMDEACQAYVERFHEGGICNVFGSIKNHITTLTVCLANHKSKKNLYWSGSWISVWILKVNPDSMDTKVKGHIRSEAHYHENGRVFMANQEDFTFRYTRCCNQKMGSEFVEIVEEKEKKYLDDLNCQFQDISDSLKIFRRGLPIRKTPMDWNVRAVKPPKPSELKV